MRLSAIVDRLRAVDEVVQVPAEDPVLAGITEDSRRVTPGMLFCAVEGTVYDGHTFLADAARRGAVAALVCRPTSEVSLPQVVIRDSRAAAAYAAARWHGNPGARLTLIGITGTNGKSTTVTILRHLLNRQATVGMIGTLGAMDGTGTTVPDTGGLTTPGPVELHGVLARLVQRGCDTVVMETSSHALDQRRLAGLVYRAAVYTNLSHDHLDYHADYDAYRAAKMLLSAQLAEGGVEAVNGDDPAWSALPVRPGIRRVTFGERPDAEVRAEAPAFDVDGTRFVLWIGGDRHDVRLPLLGEFNVSNALGAAAAAWGLGHPPARVAGVLADAPQVPGRMERLAGDGYVVLRDYAHTPDALDRVLRALRPLVTGRLIVLFGCGGDRDRTKRPVMGRIAAERADLAIATSDNPRTEDPERILDDVEAGMQGTDHLRIVDRRQAIHDALAMLKPGDCLVLAGKGHETYQIVGTERRPFDERVIVREALGSSVA